ncbi:MAG TPA: sensor domain-containing protein, partial [Marmoricola sp.]|nr:sensor domain-containing protein [Marmoricola sp.]
MNRHADSWSALRDRPWRFLRSVWPWRSLLYLLTTVPIGVGALVVLFVVLGIGLLTVVVVVGLVVLASIPAITGVVAEVERRRVALVAPSARTASRPIRGLRDRLRASRDLPVAWAEVGYAFLLATLLWVVDGVVLSTLITAPLTFLASPVIVQFDRVDILAWQVDHTSEALLLAAGPGVVLTIVAAYAVTGLAAAQAGLARVLLDPNDARLEAAVQELRRSRVDLVDAFETERRRIERDLHDG